MFSSDFFRDFFFRSSGPIGIAVLCVLFWVGIYKCTYRPPVHVQSFVRYPDSWISPRNKFVSFDFGSKVS